MIIFNWINIIFELKTNIKLLSFEQIFLHMKFKRLNVSLNHKRVYILNLPLNNNDLLSIVINIRKKMKCS